MRLKGVLYKQACSAFVLFTVLTSSIGFTSCVLRPWASNTCTTLFISSWPHFKSGNWVYHIESCRSLADSICLYYGLHRTLLAQWIANKGCASSILAKLLSNSIQLFSLLGTARSRRWTRRYGLQRPQATNCGMWGLDTHGSPAYSGCYGRGLCFWGRFCGLQERDWQGGVYGF